MHQKLLKQIERAVGKATNPDNDVGHGPSTGATLNTRSADDGVTRGVAPSWEPRAQRQGYGPSTRATA